MLLGVRLNISIKQLIFQSLLLPTSIFQTLSQEVVYSQENGQSHISNTITQKINEKYAHFLDPILVFFNDKP